MSLARTVSIEWKGEKRDFSPSMAVLQKIESGGIGLSGISARAFSNDPPFGHMAGMMFIALNSAGFRVTQDDLGFALMGHDKDATPSYTMDVFSEILLAFMPPKGDEKKPEAQTEDQ